jgi:hypothetical protein
MHIMPTPTQIILPNLRWFGFRGIGAHLEALIQWRKLLRSFSNVKILRIDRRLVGELSRSLRPDDGELPLELLP